VRSRVGPGLGLYLLFVCATPAAAQSFTLGLKGGVTVANLQIIATDSTLDPRSRAGLTAGVFAGREFGHGFGVQVEGLLSQKGTTIRDPRFDGDLDVKITYVDVPVLARYRFRVSQRMSLHALAGPVFSLKAGDSQSIGGEELSENESQKFTTGDVGLLVGGAVELGRFVFDVRYAWGVPNINDDIDREELIVRTKTLAVTMGYRWK
jgi:Outer membrane protein beta-barrel domain